MRHLPFPCHSLKSRGKRDQRAKLHIFNYGVFITVSRFVANIDFQKHGFMICNIHGWFKVIIQCVKNRI